MLHDILYDILAKYFQKGVILKILVHVYFWLLYECNHNCIIWVCSAKLIKHRYKYYCFNVDHSTLVEAMQLNKYRFVKSQMTKYNREKCFHSRADMAFQFVRIGSWLCIAGIANSSVYSMRYHFHV